jgi:hypothetical protein
MILVFFLNFLHFRHSLLCTFFCCYGTLYYCVLCAYTMRQKKSWVSAISVIPYLLFLFCCYGTHYYCVLCVYMMRKKKQLSICYFRHSLLAISFLLLWCSLLLCPLCLHDEEEETVEHLLSVIPYLLFLFCCYANHYYCVLCVYMIRQKKVLSICYFRHSFLAISFVLLWHSLLFCPLCLHDDAEEIVEHLLFPSFLTWPFLLLCYSLLLSSLCLHYEAEERIKLRAYTSNTKWNNRMAAVVWMK